VTAVVPAVEICGPGEAPRESAIPFAAKALWTAGRGLLGLAIYR